jgi:hypothetical protein
MMMVMLSELVEIGDWIVESMILFFSSLSFVLILFPLFCSMK